MRALLGLGAVLMAAAASAATTETNRPDDDPGLAVGTRVRILLADGEGIDGSPESRHVGVVSRVQPAGVSLRRASGGEVLVPFGAIERIEVSRGRGSRAKGALIGAALAGGAAALASAAWGVTCRGDECQLGTAFGLLLYTPLAAIVGGGVGAAMSPSERWERVSDRRLSLRLLPDGRGARIAVSLSF